MKTYSNKSNAKRSAVKQGLENYKIVEVNGRFAIEEDVLFDNGKTVCEAFNEKDEAVQVDLDQSHELQMYGMTNCPHCNVHLENGVGTHLQQVNGTYIKHEKYEFECLACGEEFGKLIKKPVPRVKVTNGKGVTIEKNRDVQNGIKRPSIGGVCRGVWDACDEFMSANGVSPKPMDLREKAIANGWNLNNVSIELYQWRKFNGLAKKK